MPYEQLFLASLALTVSAECLITLILKKTAGGRLNLDKIGYGRLLAVTAFASMLTLPYVWFVLPAYLPHGLPYAIISELFAFTAELLWYIIAFRINFKQAAILSVAANGFSFLLGLAIMRS